MKILLDDITCRHKLYPFTATRSVADVRIGILTIREKWQHLLAEEIMTTSQQGGGIVSGNAVPVIGACIVPAKENFTKILAGEQDHGAIELKHPWHIFQNNDRATREDFSLLTFNRQSHSISDTNKTINPQSIFIEPGAVVEHCILNAGEGPIYIGKNALIMEGCSIRGPFAMGEGSVLKMGSKIYGATTLGPYCTGGGEIKNSVLFGYSNKAHDGYLGDSVLGEWCNIGGGSSNSNIKNTAGIVKVWENETAQYLAAGTKCGLLMGDYSRCAINTSFNTGTVVGISCHIFAERFPPKFVSDFSWGSEGYVLENALRDIDNWKRLKGKSITEAEIRLLTDIYYSQKIKNA